MTSSTPSQALKAAAIGSAGSLLTKNQGIRSFSAAAAAVPAVGQTNSEGFKITNKVFFDLEVSGDPAGRVVFGLFGDTVPMAVENFRCLCTGEKGKGKSGKDLHYKGSPFYRIIDGLMALGGDFVKGDGSGGESIYGRPFRDENFDIKHTKPFQLAMFGGENKNNSRFMISYMATHWMSKQFVVFGEVIEG